MDGESVKIAIGSDHAGFLVKESIISHFSKLGYHFQDFGAFSEERMDYPDSAHPVAKSVNEGNCKIGMVICGSGNGVAIVANKYPDVRAAVCWTEEITRLARQHNDANILALPARFISMDQALQFTEIFLDTPFEGGRHNSRVAKISRTL
jgi:ribose 5-phosphate isomerase B